MYVCIVSTKEKRNDKLIRLASLQHGWVEEARGGREALPKVTNVLLKVEYIQVVINVATSIIHILGDISITLNTYYLLDGI